MNGNKGIVTMKPPTSTRMKTTRNPNPVWKILPIPMRTALITIAFHQMVIAMFVAVIKL
jgi:hypothetical protein